METEAECFSDFNYWRYPPPPITVEGACETIATDMDEETETYNDFSFWRLPPSPLQQPPRPASPGEGVREMRREWLEVEGPSEDEDDNVPDPMSMLSGNAGMRLLGLLGQLSQHLGESSRFSRAAGLLQQDMLRQREVMQQSPAANIAPLEGSTLQTPEVRDSVGSLLTILHETPGPSRTLDGPLMTAPRATAITGLFDLADVPMPPPSPASPESVATLGTPPSRFGLDNTSVSCPICLECIDDAAGALQMPCAAQHVFHKGCLLTWLDARNTCPLCRHSMPTLEDTEAPSEVAPADGEEEMADADANSADEFEMVGMEQTEPPSESV